MLAQWLRLDTPPHAVVATGLPLLAGGPRRLAHGVFGALVRNEAKLPDAPTLLPGMAARWGGRASAIAAGLSEPPPLDLTLRDAELVGSLGGVSLAPDHVRLSRGTAVAELPGYDDGAWWVQDLAASLPARLLGAGEGRAALDLCAAPGGKTLQLAAAGWRVTSLDVSDRRLDRLRENLGRTGLGAEIVVADALEWETGAEFDAILLDAPCTATGTARRHPDVLHRVGPRQIADMADLQARLLQRAVRWLKPDGAWSMRSVRWSARKARSRCPGLRWRPIRSAPKSCLNGSCRLPKGGCGPIPACSRSRAGWTASSLPGSLTGRKNSRLRLSYLKLT
jgi:16S rRNA (cytosine967-C5)-methyltransferase